MNLGATMTISHFPKSFVETNLTMKLDITLNVILLPEIIMSILLLFQSQVEVINKLMAQEYKVRRQVLLKRIDLTVQSFMWSDSAKVLKFVNSSCQKHD